MELNKGQLVAVGLIVMMGLPAGLMLINQQSLDELLQMDFTLKLKSTIDEQTFQSKYHWGATDISSASSASNIEWIRQGVQGRIQSSGDLTSAVQSVFAVASIVADSFSVDEQGYWTLHVEKKVCDGISINLDAVGNSDSISSMTPSLTVSYVPATLSSALRSAGLDSVSVIASIRLCIKGEIIEMFLWNCYQVIQGYLELTREVADWVIGTIFA